MVLAHCITFLKRVIPLPQQVGGKWPSSGLQFNDLEHLETAAYVGHLLGGASNPTANASSSSFASYGFSAAAGDAQATGRATLTNVQYYTSSVVGQNWAQSAASVQSTAIAQSGNASASAYSSSSSYYSHVGKPPSS
jgi:hypothetical protein